MSSTKGVLGSIDLNAEKGSALKNNGKFGGKGGKGGKSSSGRNIGPIKHNKRNSYVVPTNFMKKFTPSELTRFKTIFTTFDKNGDGSIESSELQLLLAELKEKCTNEHAEKLIKEVDINKNGAIEFNEFLAVLDGIRTKSGPHKATALGNVLIKHDTIRTVAGLDGAVHSYSEEERTAFAEHLNNCLKDDPKLQYLLPLDTASQNQLFEAVSDGVLLCKLINAACPDTIDERAVNLPKNNSKLSIYHKTENQNLAINAARGIGCVVVNVGAQDLIDGKPILVLGLIWQIVKRQLLEKICLKNHPELVRLLDDGESMQDLLKLKPEEILLRWVNFHLKQANSPSITNLSSDLKDSRVYLTLMQQLDSKNCNASQHLRENDLHCRATHVIRNANNVFKIETFLLPRDIVSGNKKLNLAFIAQLFNTCPGLEISDEELYDMAAMLKDDDEGSREERTFRMWINSLNIPDVYIQNLYQDLTCGLVLLKLFDTIERGIVFWKKVNFNPKSRFKKVENCNYCVVLGKQLKFSMVNVGGLDIVDCNKKLILALIWQMMRYHTVKILTSISSDSASLISDADIITWANDKVHSSGQNSSMKNFRDKALSNGIFLVDLCYAVEPRAVNWDLVHQDESGSLTVEEKRENAKYAISLARKLGAVVFLTCDDIVEVKSKMILTLVASLMATSLNNN